MKIHDAVLLGIVIVVAFIVLDMWLKNEREQWERSTKALVENWITNRNTAQKIGGFACAELAR
jgi:hypothetical protein